MAENVKTLLVVGNGFDLTHELKTRYTDFLDFVNEKVGSIVTIPQYDYQMKNYKQCQSVLSYEKALEYVKYNKNTWIGYFNTIRSNNYLEGREDWIDFEKEIEFIIERVENLILRSVSIEQRLMWIMGGYAKKSSEIIAQEFVPKLSWDLKLVTLLLEHYLIEEEKNLKAISEPFFKNLNPNAVISYNYTHTFQKLYDPDEKIPVHFIHGELGKHNLVLGIGETLPDDQKNNFTACASFKKFFQRIKYRLGNQYEKVTKIKDNKIIPWQVIIYGHSLDVTDKDSLYWLLKKRDEKKYVTNVSNANKIIIYYHDENAYNQQIANAIQIIGKDELIESVNSERIVFLPMNNSK